MRVALAVSPLPGLRVGEAHAIVRQAWLTERPDTIASRPVTDAIGMPFVGSGAEDVLAGANPQPVERGEAGERHFAYWSDPGSQAGASVLLDYTHILNGIPQEGAIRSSRLVGDDLVWAASRGAERVRVVLPVPGSVSDLGTGLLEPLAGAGPIADQLQGARHRLGNMRVEVVVPGEQQLLGLAGVARSWIAHGLGAEQAQRFENAFSEIVAQIPERTGGLTIVGAGGGFERNIYAGCGGGIAYILALLGGQIVTAGHLCVDPMGEEIEHSDLFVYVCGHIGEDLPSGLLAGSRIAAESGVPVVVIYDSGAIRKGELARLGLNGAYEIRPERSFSESEATTEELADLPRRLEEIVGRVARTWGWN
ncbi:MAG: hypothetical protein ACTH1Z_02550 [Ancrocorticia sp.]|uniref:hypothetical protein n=1 Tax=Ancrocorticia sp. TaxID=2593684 RepID=UPI003F915612